MLTLAANETRACVLRGEESGGGAYGFTAIYKELDGIKTGFDGGRK